MNYEDCNVMSQYLANAYELKIFIMVMILYPDCMQANPNHSIRNGDCTLYGIIAPTNNFTKFSKE